MITKTYSPAKGQTRNGAGPKDGKLLDSNCSTSARNHRKKGGSAPTCSSKGRVGSLHFHPHQAVMRYSNPHTSLTLNPHGMRECWVGKLVLSPKPGSDKQFPLSDSVSGDQSEKPRLAPPSSSNEGPPHWGSIRAGPVESHSPLPRVNKAIPLPTVMLVEVM